MSRDDLQTAHAVGLLRRNWQSLLAVGSVLVGAAGFVYALGAAPIRSQIETHERRISVVEQWQRDHSEADLKTRQALAEVLTAIRVDVAEIKGELKVKK